MRHVGKKSSLYGCVLKFHVIGEELPIDDRKKDTKG